MFILIVKDEYQARIALEIAVQNGYSLGVEIEDFLRWIRPTKTRKYIRFSNGQIKWGVVGPHLVLSEKDTPHILNYEEFKDEIQFRNEI